MEKNSSERYDKVKSDQYAPQIIVKFHEGGSLEEVDGRIRATNLSLERFERAVQRVKGATACLSSRMNREKLHLLQRTARRNLKRSIPSLDLFVRITVPDDTQVEDLLKELRADPQVEYACVAGVPGPPPVTPDYTGQQNYQDPAPDGIDASFAWFYPGGDGTGVQICDCEYGCDRAHEDLPTINVVSNRDGRLTSFENHGTAVLGVLGAIADAKGVTGISPGSTLMFASESGGNREDCIDDAIAVLSAGDILVLEMQTGNPYRPAEYDPDVHASITTAAGAGIVVIAAGGNGGGNLNTLTNANGDRIWDPNHADYDDSGAIIVGAGGSIHNADPHSKLSFSVFGDRVTCQGWGEDVTTTGYGWLYDNGEHEEYTEAFNGTSSATPVVAGMVACLQGAAIQAFGAPLLPAVIRALLADPTNGTPQADSTIYPAATFSIGPLPDLRRLLRAANIFPDVYMRDNVADTGTEPYQGGTLCWSPDIIVRPSAVANPDVAFGPTTWNDANLCSEIEFGQENHIYVRMHNRGNVPDDVTVSVYWTQASGFLHPATWNPLGTVTVNSVGAGEKRVANPILWPKANVPPIGHYCLIAVVNSDRDPLTVPGPFASIGEYLDFIRNHNNICYRNCNVVDAILGAPIPPYVVTLNGLIERADRFRLEVRHDLPDGALLELKIDRPIPRFETVIKKKRDRRMVQYIARETVFRMESRRPLILDDVPIRRHARVKMEIAVKLPKDTLPGEYLVYADQLLGKKRLGRVNYVLRVRDGIKKIPTKRRR